jgi:hypothetical protein
MQVIRHHHIFIQLNGFSKGFGLHPLLNEVFTYGRQMYLTIFDCPKVWFSQVRTDGDEYPPGVE